VLGGRVGVRSADPARAERGPKLIASRELREEVHLGNLQAIGEPLQ